MHAKGWIINPRVVDLGEHCAEAVDPCNFELAELVFDFFLAPRRWEGTRTAHLENELGSAEGESLARYQAQAESFMLHPSTAHPGPATHSIWTPLKA